MLQYAAEPEILIEQLRKDEAIAGALDSGEASESIRREPTIGDLWCVNHV
jgi:hypothetical protein